MRHERFENAGQELGWNSAAGVGNFEAQMRINSLHSKQQHLLVRFRHGLARIANQIAENACEPVGIHIYLALVEHFDPDIDSWPAFGEIGLEALDELIHANDVKFELSMAAEKINQLRGHRVHLPHGHTQLNLKSISVDEFVQS